MLPKLEEHAKNNRDFKEAFDWLNLWLQTGVIEYN